MIARRLAEGTLRKLAFGKDKVPLHVDTNYINASAMCKARGKAFSGWRRLEGTKAILQRISEDTGLADDELIVYVEDKERGGGATWVHYEVAAALAAWVDPMFVVFLVKEHVRRDEVPPTREAAKCIDWPKQLGYAREWADVMKLGGGMDQRDQLFFRDAVRVIGRNLFVHTTTNSQQEIVAETALQPELSISETFMRNGIPHPTKDMLLKAGRLASKRYREDHDGERPPTRRQHVDGVEREVNHYYMSDLPWLSEIVRLCAQ